MSRRRSGAEFSDGIKNAERRVWYKKHKGHKKEKLHVHHILNVSTGKRLGVPREALKSRRNAVCVTEDFHREIHSKQLEEDQIEFANFFIKLFARLF